jgi:hypothetical protein
MRRWIEIMEAGHAVGLPSTVTMMFAHIETYGERVEHLLRARESQDRTGGYTAFIPWTFQPANTPLQNDPALKAAVEAQGFTGSVDYLRTLAISRIALDNFPNLQASWVTQERRPADALFGPPRLDDDGGERRPAAGTTTADAARPGGMIRAPAHAGQAHNGYRVLQVIGGIGSRRLQPVVRPVPAGPAQVALVAVDGARERVGRQPVQELAQLQGQVVGVVSAVDGAQEPLERVDLDLHREPVRRQAGLVVGVQDVEIPLVDLVALAAVAVQTSAVAGEADRVGDVAPRDRVAQDVVEQRQQLDPPRPRRGR